MTLRPALWLVLWLMSAMAVLAQGQSVPIAPPVGSDQTQVDPAATTTVGIAPSDTTPNYETWAQTAARAEAMIQGGRASPFALQRTRSDIVVWRDAFLIEQSANAGRIGTVQTQIDAIGAVPAEDGPVEDAAVTARRNDLRVQMADLRAPVTLAQEAHAHANGLIGEIDTLIRAQQAKQLMTRGPSPLNPRIWPDVIDAISARVVGLWKEVMTSVRSDVRQATLAETWPQVGFFLILAMVLLLRGRRWMRMLETFLTEHYPRGSGVWQFGLSLAQIILPMIGLYTLTGALHVSGLFGFRATQLINAVPLAGMYVLVARWLAGHFFGALRSNPVPFDFSDTSKTRLRRLVIQLGWMFGALTVALAFINTGEVDAVVRGVVILPFEVVMAWILFRFGREIAHRTADLAEAAPATDEMQFRRQIMALAGRVVMVASLVAPFLSVLGFSAAAAAILYPMILTLALIGLVLLLQWLVYDLYSLVTKSENRGRDALLPVLVGFILVVCALPFLSLIWGARVEDLNEIWTRFRDGYAIGETRISPTDFITFVLIFVAGYLLTRLLQSTLRTSILPKTKMDIGGQNAVVSGLGYVGIFLAAVLAVTSTGLDLSNLAIVAGALSVGIGFGLQTVVSNFVSGIILLIERPISEGDWIEVGGRMGYVRDISVRSTRIETFDRTDVIVPNADLVSGQVVNWTRGNSVGRVIVPVSVVFGTDTAKVQAVLQEIAESHPMVLLVPPPSVVLVNFGADALNYEIRAIVRDVNFGLTVRSEMNQTIARRFFDEGIELAGMARANASPGRTALSEPVPPAVPDVDLASAYTHKAALRKADGDDG